MHSNVIYMHIRDSFISHELNLKSKFYTQASGVAQPGGGGGGGGGGRSGFGRTNLNTELKKSMY